MGNEAPRAARQVKFTCVGRGAPVGSNSRKYTREMCVRCYARALDGQPIGGRDDRGPRPRRASSDDEDKAPRG